MSLKIRDIWKSYTNQDHHPISDRSSKGMALNYCHWRLVLNLWPRGKTFRILLQQPPATQPHCCIAAKDFLYWYQGCGRGFGPNVQLRFLSSGDSISLKEITELYPQAMEMSKIIEEVYLYVILVVWKELSLKPFSEWTEAGCVCVCVERERKKERCSNKNIHFHQNNSATNITITKIHFTGFYNLD